MFPGMDNYNASLSWSLLTQSRKRIYATALIVLFFDVTLSIACFFGIGALMSASEWIELIVLGIGSIVVLLIGLGLVRSRSTVDMNAKVDIPIMKVIATACVVTWFNPQALIDGSMLLGPFRATLPGDQGLLFISGVACASTSWWLGLSTIVSLFRTKITDRILRIINIVCGAIIMFYGVKLFISFVELISSMF